MNKDLYRMCHKAIDEAIDQGHHPDVVFDHFIDAAEMYAELKHQHSYCRVFWHDETDLDDAICDLLDTVKSHQCTDYAVITSGDLNATFVAIVYRSFK